MLGIEVARIDGQRSFQEERRLATFASQTRQHSSPAPRHVSSRIQAGGLTEVQIRLDLPSTLQEDVSKLCMGLPPRTGACGRTKTSLRFSHAAEPTEQLATKHEELVLPSTMCLHLRFVQEYQCRFMVSGVCQRTGEP
jgi:hypothetical protein